MSPRQLADEENSTLQSFCKSTRFIASSASRFGSGLIVEHGVGKQKYATQGRVLKQKDEHAMTRDTISSRGCYS